MKVLNIDELAPVEKEVIIKGNTYAIEEMSVEGFIEWKALLKKIETKKAEAEKAKAEGREAEGFSDEDYIEMMRMTVRIAIPSLPAEVAATLKLVQLSKLCDFINGSLDEGEQQGAAAIAADGEGAAKKS